MKKTYVLDTNILMTSPNALFGFADNDVVITGTTLQELDAHKGDPGERGYNTRETVRLLESLRKQGSLIEGVKTWDGGRIMLDFQPDTILRFRIIVSSQLYSKWVRAKSIRCR